MEFSTDEAATTQLRREIACRLVADSGLFLFIYVNVSSLMCRNYLHLCNVLENLSELCRACGKACQSPGTKKDGQDDWVSTFKILYIYKCNLKLIYCHHFCQIECTTCSLWFHWVCVGRPPLNQNYFCPACTL